MRNAQVDEPRLRYLFTPAAMADTVLGELIEEVGMMCDEPANVAWQSGMFTTGLSCEPSGRTWFLGPDRKSVV